MRWFRFIDIWTPQVFSPKVTPDPASAERLDEKFVQAMRKLKKEDRRSRPGEPVSPL